MTPLTVNDFPIFAIGHNVYRKTESSPICSCNSQFMAGELANMLNECHQRRMQGAPRPEPGTYVGGGFMALRPDIQTTDGKF